MSEPTPPPCAGMSQFHVAAMLKVCATCDRVPECRQLAADAPFMFPACYPQVWGGLVLPRDADQLPPPRQAASYPDQDGRTVTWLQDVQRSQDPDTR